MEWRDGLTRRDFLRGVVAAGGMAALVACMPGRGRGQQFEAPYQTATAARVLASPQAGTPAAEGTPTPEGEADAGALERFLALSAVLTGVPNLDPVVGRIYMQSLQASDEFNVTLEALYEQAGFNGGAAPDSIEALEARGLFGGGAEEGGASALADHILETWYTGVYTTAEGEQAVATFVDSLAWKALAFTKPTTICARPGFWEARPEVQIGEVSG